MKLNSIILGLVLCAPFAGAQQNPAIARSGATITGVVCDSIAHAPLSDATVQLVAADDPARFAKSAITDGTGLFSISDIPDGRYHLGFFHPMLDSIGVEAPLRLVTVSGQKAIDFDLAIPSPSRIRSAICGPNSVRDTVGLIVGFVRDASDGEPAAKVAVTGEWMEMTIAKTGVSQHVKHLVAVTGDNGWFAICSVPRGGTMMLTASRGADSTDAIEVNVPTSGFVRRQLFLGTSHTTVAAGAGDSAASARRIRVGNGQLSGKVVTVADGKAVPNATISISDGPQTRANASGEWSLSELPGGTRMLEVRALGFYPSRQRVDIVAGAPEIRVALSTLKAVLDTVKITASRIGNNAERNGFAERSRKGFGHFLTPDFVEKRNVIVTSDLFRFVPGVHLEADSGSNVLKMRSAFGDCKPAIYVNDHYMDLSPDDIDHWVHPKEIAGIEIYTEGTVPAQFQQGMSGCGSIVIWTK